MGDIFFVSKNVFSLLDPIEKIVIKMQADRGEVQIEGYLPSTSTNFKPRREIIETYPKIKVRSCKIPVII